MNFYYSDGKSKSVNLYTTEQHYYIEEYLYNNTFNYDYIFKISIFISLATIVFIIHIGIKKNNFKISKLLKNSILEGKCIL